MQYLAPTGVRRYERPRAITLAALGVVVSSSVAMASPASAAPATQKAFVSSSVPAGQPIMTSRMPRLSALGAATMVASLASQAAARRVTTTTVWSDRSSVRAGSPVRLTGKVTYGANQLRVPANVVNLQVKAGGTWKTVSSHAASSDGSVVFTVTPTKSSTYRLAYDDVQALADSVSAAKTVTVTNSSASTSGISSAGYSAVTTGTGRGAQVVAAAAAQTGKPYQYGAAGPNAFDCSGLTQYVFKTVGISLPHSADAQKSYGKAVSQANALPGDLIIFLSGGNGYHAAIYAGGGYMYDAPNSGSTVGKHKIYSGTVIFRRLV